jgi:hypothetical protein
MVDIEIKGLLRIKFKSFVLKLYLATVPYKIHAFRRGGSNAKFKDFRARR